MDSKLPLDSIDDIYIPETDDKLVSSLLQAHIGNVYGLVSADIAIREIKAGRKINHWMWYMFPALNEIRGKGTQHKEFLLSDFGGTCAFLIDLKGNVIYDNIMNITRSVNEELKKGRSSSSIFNNEHDAEKFYQAVSLFYLASQIICLFKDDRCKAIFKETYELFGTSLRLLGRGMHGWTFKIANDWITSKCKLHSAKGGNALSPWYCCKCTHHNKATKMKCDACYAPRSTC